MKKIKVDIHHKRIGKKSKGYKEFETINELLLFLKMKKISKEEEQILYDKLCRFNYVEIGSWRVHGIMY